ncbi:GPI anchored serine-threonine rich family protein [Aspergillus puulaauensis]|uniref:Yeast cell wall synthesis Kre9/Knh1-like N-terminal domain-containing protein n=1 Tax=Aspergillus puulaauensis TaxID=1220207 RepID=A0A7R7XGZ3_9EURO|nr:uncharacterized protein APUU_21677S [Aspergillus puulaauensis]BCS21245.1 hypothetical protein APUU_21677S [Aspergillus puulaauensis]
MYFLKPLIATWACLAQVSLAGVAFTKWPTTAYTGKPSTVYYQGDPDSPATITLRHGPSGNLKTLKVLTTQAEGGSYTWVPDEDLPAGPNYALQIEQDGSINYTGLLKIANRPDQKPARPSASQNTPLPSDSNTPLSGGKTVQKGNNGYLPILNGSSTDTTITSNKGATTESNDGATSRYISPEMMLAALAATVYFAA